MKVDRPSRGQLIQRARLLGLEGVAVPGSLRFSDGILRSFDLPDLQTYFDHAKEIHALVPRPEIFLQPDQVQLHLSLSGETVYYLRTLGSETESGRTTYYSGTLLLTAYHVPTRTPICLWSRTYYADDSDSPQSSGMILETRFMEGGQGVELRYQDGSSECVQFGSFKV